jgi:hypothetical protein
MEKIITLWVETDRTVIYDIARHAALATRFLCYETLGRLSLIIVGSFTTHGELRVCAKKHDIQFPSATIGAGRCHDGFVTYWGSVGSGLVTPPYLRPPIKESLGLNEKE